VRARAGRAAVRADPCQQALDAEAKALQDGAEQLRVLVAVAAAPLEDDLFLDRLQVDADLPLEEHIEVLEPHAAQVRAVQGKKRALGRFSRSLVTDPPQVGLKI